MASIRVPAALKEARRLFPRQEPACENIKHMLRSQIEPPRAVHAAHEGGVPRLGAEKWKAPEGRACLQARCN
jgi:hypothetical protein